MNMKNEMIPAGISGLNQVPQHGLLLNIVEGSGCFIRHAREGRDFFGSNNLTFFV